MNPDYEKILEAEVDQALKGLKDLPAPQSLLLRVMSVIEQRATLPWYRQAWSIWPLPLRVASLAFMLTLFGGVCFGSWQLMHTEFFLSATHKISNWLAGPTTLWNALNAVVNALGLAIKQLGTGIIVGGLLAFAMGYALCLSLGSAVFRLAVARR